MSSRNQANRTSGLGSRRFQTLVKCPVAKSFQITLSPTCTVTGVGRGSEAESVGVRAGDKIIDVDGRPVHNLAQLTTQMHALSTGTLATFLLERDSAAATAMVQPPAASREAKTGKQKARERAIAKAEMAARALHAPAPAPEAPAPEAIATPNVWNKSPDKPPELAAVESACQDFPSLSAVMKQDADTTKKARGHRVQSSTPTRVRRTQKDTSSSASKPKRSTMDGGNGIIAAQQSDDSLDPTSGAFTTKGPENSQAPREEMEGPIVRTQQARADANISTRKQRPASVTLDEPQETPAWRLETERISKELKVKHEVQKAKEAKQKLQREAGQGLDDTAKNEDEDSEDDEEASSQAKRSKRSAARAGHGHRFQPKKVDKVSFP